MPVLNPTQATLIGVVVAPALFILTAYLTRADRRHILGAVTAAFVYAAVNFVWDRAAASLGWWAYPAWTAAARLPFVVYLIAGIVGGGASGLIGWRVVQRWGRFGLAGFLSFWALYGVVHDYGGSQLFASSGLMVFGSGPVPVVANILWYMVGNAAALATVWFIGGSGDISGAAGMI